MPSPPAATPRKSNPTGRLFPARCYFKHGAYYYVDRQRKWHRLGKTVPDALRAYARILDGQYTPRTMGEVFTRYEKSVIPDKAKATQRTDLYCLKRLRPVFQNMLPSQIQPHHVWRYWDERGHSRGARLEIGVLSHCLTMAMRWGLAKANPCRGLEIPKGKPRQRYVSDTEFQLAYAAAPERLQLMMVIALATGLRLTDILALSPESLGAEGLVVRTSKTGPYLCFTWSPELQKAAETLVALSPITESGFASAWQRLMRKFPKPQRFQFRDLRAKSASDSETLGAATERLGHSNPAITQRVYMRKPRKVATLRYANTPKS